MKNNEIYELAPLNPGWIKKRVPDSFADEGLKKIIIFYVINTPCIYESSSGICVSEYGWGNDVWRKGKLKKALFSVAGLERGATFCTTNKLPELKSLFEKQDMKKGFYKNRSVEKIVMHISPKYKNEILSIFLHIRNAFAHGRLAMYEHEPNDIMFVLEDGVKRNGEFHVRSRMIIKKSTLLKWIDIIQAGPSKLSESEEKV